MNISVIFPIAGLGSRFGYTFKPFLKATEYTFIELAKKPFDILTTKGYHVTYYFIYRESQEKKYNVTATLKELFPKDHIVGLLIGDTDGPLQTLQQAIQKYGLQGSAFVCDCDHAIQIGPILDKIDMLQDVEVIIPTWNIEEKDDPHYGKVKLDPNYQIVDFCEKESMSREHGFVKGLIGCYLFQKIEMLTHYPPYENISSLLKQLLSEKKRMLTASILEADFFGTPKTLQDFRFKRAQTFSIFIDVDGTLIHQTTKKLLPGTLDKLHYWKSQGHRIILTTATDTNHRTKLLQTLKDFQIPYDDLLLGLPPGPRFVINDRKPYIPYYCMAEGFVIDRDHGIGDIDLPKNAPLIVKQLKGASFAQVYLVEDTQNHRFFVRKYISKTNELLVHADILKRQCEDMKRLYFYKKGICPRILYEYDSPSEYYYDMEYLEGYETLSQFDTETVNSILPTILHDLQTYVYCYKKQMDAEERVPWLQDYLDEKVYPKFKMIEDLHPELQHLLHLETISINHQTYASIQSYLQQICLEKYTPDCISPIHGDLTLENILYHPETKEYKLIDPSGSRYMDAPEMDIAKLFQSLVCNYSSWDHTMGLVKHTDSSYSMYPGFLKDAYDKVKHLYDPIMYRKGLFYMCTYFIRMVPFMIHNKSIEHAIFILLLTIYHLDYIVHSS